MTARDILSGQQKRWLSLIILPALTLAVLIISIFALVMGWQTIFQNLYYFPIILACVYYGKRGFVFSVLLACSYFFLMAIFSHDPVVLEGAVVRVLIFILVAGVITYLSLIRIRAEEALQENEEKFREIFNHANDGIHIHEITGDAFPGKLIEVNDVACRMVGSTREQLFRTNTVESIPECYHPPLDTIKKQLLSTGSSTFETGLRRKDGLIVPVEVNARVVTIQKKEVLISIIRDITERKKAETEIRLFARIADDAPVSISAHDFEGTMLYANEATFRLHGYTREEFLSLNLHDLDVPESEQLISQRMRQIQENGEAEFDACHFRKDRSRIPLHVSVKIVDWGGRKVLLSIATDLTERKKMEAELATKHDNLMRSYEQMTASEEELKAQFDELCIIQKALRESEERFRLTLDATNDGIWDWNVSTGIALFSPHWYTMLGYEPDELPASYATWRSLIHPDDLGTAEEMIQKHIHQKDDGYTVEFRMLTKQGAWRWVLARGKVIERDDDDKPLRMVGTHTDITGLKLVENTLLRVNQKLNVITQFTRKDLTNKIFVMNSYLALIAKYAEGQDLILDSVQKSEWAARSVSDIIEFTKDYQDMGAKPPKWQNVKMTFLFGLSHIAIGNIHHNIETENLEIFADPLLEKACQGLFENLLAHGEHVSRVLVWHKIHDNGVTIVFEDDGVGISHDKKETIFLRGDQGPPAVRGLNFVREILDITGITIRETGEPGKGARFEIMVPRDRTRFNKD